MTAQRDLVLVEADLTKAEAALVDYLIPPRSLEVWVERLRARRDELLEEHRREENTGCALITG
jgi:hypothetical protein